MRNVQRGERRDLTQGEITMKGEEFQRIRTRRKWIIWEMSTFLKCPLSQSVRLLYLYNFCKFYNTNNLYQIVAFGGDEVRLIIHPILGRQASQTELCLPPRMTLRGLSDL